MKSKPKKLPEPELEQEDDVEVEDSGPEIATGKKSKFAIIAASTVLTVVVVYIFFFSSSDKKNENLEKIEVPPVANVAPSESGKSPFELELPKEETEEKKEENDLDILAQPKTPELPSLPQLSEDAVLPDKIEISSEQKPGQVQQNQALIPAQEQQQVQQNQNQQVLQNQNQVEANKVDPKTAPIVIFSGAVNGAAPPRGVGYENNIVNLTRDPVQELPATTTAITPTRIADMPHTIAQGKLLSAVLETSINTELPGSVRAVVSRDVFGESGNEVLIPKGSRLFGSYSSQVVRGQGRVEIAWTRLIRPDGVDMAITFNASDQFGRAGIPGEVDNKFSSIIANSMMTSILAVGGVAAAQQLLAGDQNTTITTNPTQGTTTTTGSATNQALYDVTRTIIDTVGQLISSTIDLNPSIRVPQGTKITVIVNADVTLPSARRR